MPGGRVSACCAGAHASAATHALGRGHRAEFGAAEFMGEAVAGKKTGENTGYGRVSLRFHLSAPVVLNDRANMICRSLLR